MKKTLAWLNAAIAEKDIGGGMTYYKVNGKEISATDGRLTACAPWSWGGKFFVPGMEFEKILRRLSDDLTIEEGDGFIKLKSGRFRGTIQTLPLTEWSYPGMDTAKWLKIPAELFPLLEALRPFVSENENPAWGRCVSLTDGWTFATNNIVIAGAPCKGLGKCKALLPAWTIDFLLSRLTGLVEWTWDEHFMAFRWKNGAWMRSQLVVGQFNERAIEMVQAASKSKTTQKIENKFREAIERVGELAEDTVLLHAKHIEARFGKAVIADDIACKVPKGQDSSIFGARFLLPMLKAADSWSPDLWPAPVPWKGARVSGYIVGRRA